MRLVLQLTVMFFLLVSTSVYALAAKPTSITFKDNHSGAAGEAYSTYDVECSNGKRIEISAWSAAELVATKRWCVGQQTQICNKKQITIAKKVCK